MSNQLSIQSDFSESFAIHLALKHALKSKKLDKLPAVRKAANGICKNLTGDRSVYTRQLRMISMMEKGATMTEMYRKLKCSRRTLYRYLNEFEAVGLSLELENKKYSIPKMITQMLRV